MNQIENNKRIDRLVRERWMVEERLTTLKAAVRQLLRDHAGFEPHSRNRPSASSGHQDQA
jgi:chaperonin cofactor prefoldin